MMKKSAAFAAVLLASLAAASVRAEDNPSRNEFYLGLILPYNAIGGDIDGKRFYKGPDGDAGVPDVKNALGAGLVLGIKSDRPSGHGIALEGSIQGSRHKNEISGGPDSDFGLISADLKFFPTTRARFQPWVQTGVSFASLQVDNGFFSNGQTKDETFTGAGINLGAGLLAYASPRVAFHLAAIYRFIRYNEVDYGRNSRLRPSLNGDMLSVELGITFRLHRD